MIYYPNGMVKEYRSDLVVYDPELKSPYRKSIIVNDPLTYRGISFYQAASGPIGEYSVVLRNQASGSEQAFRVPADRDVTWPGTTVSFRIEELRQEEDGTVHQAKIRLTPHPAAAPSIFWVDNQSTVAVGQAGENFTVSFRQLYVTQLRVAKDPGVLSVYFGCLLMVVGLAICFVLSHRRIWVYIAPVGKKGTQILVSGTSNKNKPTFERQFQELVTHIKQDAATFTPPKGT
jgi:cytochrome c biogenesis protein